VSRAPVAYMYLVLIQGNNIISCNKYLNIQLALEYGHEQVKLRKKRWNNKESLIKINMQTES
jgi:hypothetical protein